MYYRIRKPFDIDKWASWCSDMDYLNNKYINLNDYKVKLIGKTRYIVVDNFLISFKWLTPVRILPAKVEKSIRE